MDRKTFESGAVRLVEMPPAELEALNKKVKKTLETITALGKDETVFEKGTGRILDMSRLPQGLCELIEMDPAEFRDTTSLRIEAELVLLHHKTCKALDIQQIRKDKEFTQAACSALFDKKPAPGSLNALFGVPAKKS